MREKFAFVCTVIFAVLSPVSGQATFQGLGDLAGGGFYSRAFGLSADGTYVVGGSESALGYEAFRWSQTTGMVPLGDLAGGNFDSEAWAVSADGSVVVGRGALEEWDFPQGYRDYYSPFRWTAADGLQELLVISPPYLPRDYNAYATDVSDDGLVVVGEIQQTGGLGTLGYRWTSSGVELYGELFQDSAAHGITGDGSMVVGWLDDLQTGLREACRWTDSGGHEGLGFLDADRSGSAWAVSADGEVVVGCANTDFGKEAFLWTSAQGMIGLGHLSGGSGFYPYSFATDVSGDGSIVIGHDGEPAWMPWPFSSYAQAFIWDEQNNMRHLKEVFENDFDLDLTGWTLTSAEGISDDGRTLVGFGINPAGKTEAWIATVPEPTTFCLLALGGLGLLRRRRV